MDFDNITTPADLERENSKPSQEDKVVDLIMAMGVKSGHEIVQRCVTAALDLHKERVMELVESEDCDRADIVLWTKDLEKLAQVSILLSEVDI